MSKIHDLIRAAYVSEYDFDLKKKYSLPKIYDAGGDLSKRWYVYYSFRNPATDKLERQTPIYAEVNQFKDLKTRSKAIKILQKAIAGILANGYNPFTDENSGVKDIYNIPEAVQMVLSLKKSKLSPTGYQDFRIRLQQFEKWLLKNGFTNRLITSVTKKTVIAYLNTILISSSPRNRNNVRLVLSGFFSELEANEIIPNNFVDKVEVLKTNPVKNKTFNSDQLTEINALTEKDFYLSLYIKFISYNFLRPVEVSRLLVKDIVVKDKQLRVKTKTGHKLKIIPDLLLDELPDLKQLDPNAFLFTPKGFGEKWIATEISRRNHFGKRFSEVKRELKLGKDYGLYSFRHTFITKLYRELRVTKTPAEAKSHLMLITGHTNMTTLEKYLRDIDAELPEDYSHLLTKPYKLQ